MDYVREAVEYLKNYDRLKTSIENLKDEILELKIDIKSISCMTYSDMPSGSGNDSPDDKIVNMMFRIKRAEDEYRNTTRTLKRIDKVFEKFGEVENIYAKVLRGYFIEQYTEEQLMKDFNYSDRHLRRLKQQALKAFAIEIFGINVIGA